jgi:hypothetical protein
MTDYDEEKHDDVAAVAAATAADNNDDTEEEKYTHKIYIGRVPTKFTEDTVKRILIEKMMLGTDNDSGSNSNSDTNIIEKVELIYPHDDDGNDKDGGGGRGGRGSEKRSTKDKEDEIKKRNLDRAHGIDVEHRGFGFIIFSTEKYRDDALKLQTIRGGRKLTSKKLYTMYLRPYVAITYDDDNGNNDGGGGEAKKEEGASDNNNNARDICYLWNLHRCPYGNECKFRHVGVGSCLKTDDDLSPEELKQIKRKRNGKCFIYKKKGKCDKGEECLYSHDFDVSQVSVSDVVTKDEKEDESSNASKSNKSESKSNSKTPNSLKDCINWKTKGKCRKGDKCVYKHDPELQKKALEKKAIKNKQNSSKKRKHDDNDNEDNDNANKRSSSNYQGGNNRKEKQPLCVRIFGLNYDTTENDIKEFIQSKLGSTGNDDDDNSNPKKSNQNSNQNEQQHLIKSVLFPKFEDSNRSKGYCGIYFASPKAALDCVSKCDNEELHGRWLRVQTGKSMTIDEWDGLHNK